MGEVPLYHRYVYNEARYKKNSTARHLCTISLMWRVG